MTTDKQIIIDGTQCRYASFGGGNTQRLLCAIDDCFCDCYRENECYYKQLKAKEQECEELKKIIHRLQDECTEKTNAIIALGEQLEAYKMEAEEGKEINAELKAENKTQKETIDRFLTVLGMLGKNNIKLRETLTEIKEIAEKYNNAHFGEQQYCCKDILQKISECEVNDVVII